MVEISRQFPSNFEAELGFLGHNLLIPAKNAIELQSGREPNQHTDSYARACFMNLLMHDSKFKILGPHLIDLLFSQVPKLRKHSRPDAIRLTYKNQDEWQIDEIDEFKSGGHLKGPSSLAGFSKLLNVLRDEPELLPFLLKQRYNVLRPAMPSKISVLPEEEIMAKFYSPLAYQDRQPKQSTTRFKVQHVTFPLPSPALNKYVEKGYGLI